MKTESGTDDPALKLIDLDRYPIHEPEAPAILRCIELARNGLAQDGCARLGGFIRPDRREQLAIGRASV